MYKHSHHWLSSIFDMFTKNSDIHQYYTRQSELLHIPIFNTEIGKRSFRAQATTIWNHICCNIGSLDIKIGTFKIHLKKLLLKE